MPGQAPKVYGAPMGAQAPSAATDRNVAAPATDEQVKLAYQAYMRQVIQAAHAHFDDHLQKQQQAAQAPATPAAPPATPSGNEPIYSSGSVPRVQKAVADAGG